MFLPMFSIVRGNIRKFTFLPTVMANNALPPRFPQIDGLRCCVRFQNIEFAVAVLEKYKLFARFE